jgi:hypothetical protein
MSHIPSQYSKPNKGHCSERGRTTSVANSDITDRPRRSVLSGPRHITMKTTITFFAVWTLGLLGTHLAYSQENSPAFLTALRDAKTEELLLDGKRTEDTWFSGSFGFLFEQANIKRVETNADITFVFRTQVTTAAADYVPQLNASAQPMRVATGATVKGTLRIESQGRVVGTIPFDGSRGTTSTYSLTGSSNPLIAALARSGLHKKVLSAFVAARGHDIIKPIVDKYRMVLSVSTDWDGGMASYEAVFPVLAESSESWASEMLSNLAKDTDSPSAKRLAEDALKAEKKKGLTK